MMIINLLLLSFMVRLRL